ncbi:hypothetical protein BDK51DRAFT_42403 [Blyttiomyces helicus]|uniref:Uncharacterized protein n=1 Tax=Blyttiomyces helicus TaxID=388810 RepID=A0A4P9WKW1_9FUNG|nr:hypothetical protein BDK51DRAFT_42403 [Blyttiomyces helicus]|eukprot:RKO92775.1 hypothetical protein BDK51DRAFT_42403 [Blyttiomyces helicus]
MPQRCPDRGPSLAMADERFRSLTQSSYLDCCGRRLKMGVDGSGGWKNAVVEHDGRGSWGAQFFGEKTGAGDGNGTSFGPEQRPTPDAAPGPPPRRCVQGFLQSRDLTPADPINSIGGANPEMMLLGQQHSSRRESARAEDATAGLPCERADYQITTVSCRIKPRLAIYELPPSASSGPYQIAECCFPPSMRDSDEPAGILHEDELTIEAELKWFQKLILCRRAALARGQMGWPERADIKMEALVEASKVLAVGFFKVRHFERLEHVIDYKSRFASWDLEPSFPSKVDTKPDQLLEDALYSKYSGILSSTDGLVVPGDMNIGLILPRLPFENSPGSWDRDFGP